MMERIERLKKPICFIKSRLYLLIPLFCIFFWALLSLIKDNFKLEEAADFNSFYLAGKYIFQKPEAIYTDLIAPRYFYLPNIATVFSLLALFDYVQACWIFFFILLIVAWLSIIEFNKILKLKGIDNKFNRFLILFTISNGLIIMANFDVLQTKFIALFLILLFLRREIELGSLEKNNKEYIRFLFIQLSILVFSISLIPYLFLIIPIYLFYKVDIKDIFKKSQIEKYLIFIGTFFIQNFMFLIFPSLINGFIGGLNRSFSIRLNITPEYIIAQRAILKLPPNSMNAFISSFNIPISMTLLSIISLLITGIACIILIIRKNLSIEEKFAYFIFITIIFNVYFHNENAFVTFLPLITILFIDLKTESGLINNLKKNYLNIIGLLCILISALMPPIYLFYEYLTFTKSIPLPILIMRRSIVYLIILFTLILIKLKKNNIIKPYSLDKSRQYNS